MIDMIVFMLGIIVRPFKSRLFFMTFFFFFIPTSFFGIYYKYFGEQGDSFFSYFTPESIFTVTIPLMATVLMEGMLAAINKLTAFDKESAEFQMVRDSLVLSLFILLVLCLIIYHSITHKSLLLSSVSVFLLLLFWIAICSTKKEFSPSKRWRATGTANTTSSSDVTNG